MTASRSCPQCGARYDVEQRYCALDGAVLRGGLAGTDLTGEIVADRYLVKRRLGAGGMGEVYLAEHVRIGRPCALKVLRPELAADADAVGRFYREAANASRVTHRGVAAVYDFGETAEGVVYLAMELVDGESLRAVLERDGALVPARALALVTQIAAALDAAHAHGIVHRDLKPENVLLAREADGGDVAKIVDFGIAKGAGGESQQVTRPGGIVGTPEFMAPEQLAGDPTDHRTDVYALALVAYALLTARNAFDGERAGDTLAHRLTMPPRRLATLRPEIVWPTGVQAALDRALARRPDDRQASAGALAAELSSAFRLSASVVAVLPTSGAVPPTQVYLTPQPQRRPAPRAPRRWTLPPRRAGVLGAGLGALALALGAAQLRPSAAAEPGLGAPQALATASAASPPAIGVSSTDAPMVASPLPAEEPTEAGAVAPTDERPRPDAPPTAEPVDATPAPPAPEAAAEALLARVQSVIDAQLVAPDTAALARALNEVERARPSLDAASPARLRLEVARGVLLGLADRTAEGCAQLAAAGTDPRLPTVLSPAALAEFDLLRASCR